MPSSSTAYDNVSSRHGGLHYRECLQPSGGVDSLVAFFYTRHVAADLTVTTSELGSLHASPRRLLHTLRSSDARMRPRDAGVRMSGPAGADSYGLRPYDDDAPLPLADGGWRINRRFGSEH